MGGTGTPACAWSFHIYGTGTPACVPGVSNIYGTGTPACVPGVSTFTAEALLPVPGVSTFTVQALLPVCLEFLHLRYRHSCLRLEFLHLRYRHSCLCAWSFTFTVQALLPVPSAVGGNCPGTGRSACATRRESARKNAHERIVRCELLVGRGARVGPDSDGLFLFIHSYVHVALAG